MTASREDLELLHRLLSERLLEVARSGDMTAAFALVIRRFLADNGVNVTSIRERQGSLEEGLEAVLAELPFHGEDREEESEG